MLAAGKGRSGRYSNRKKQPNRVRLSEVGGRGSGGIEVWGRGWQSGRVNRLIVLGVGTRRGEVGPVQEGTGTA